MGALPKNKITRAERGKRRRGNKPKIVQDLKKAKPKLHKQGIITSILKKIGAN